jgi:hypothetical protein
MPQVGFKLMNPVFEQMNTVHALDCASTVIGFTVITYTIRYLNIQSEPLNIITWNKVFIFHIRKCFRQNLHVFKRDT